MKVSFGGLLYGGFTFVQFGLAFYISILAWQSWQETPIVSSGKMKVNRLPFGSPCCKTSNITYSPDGKDPER